MPARSGTPGHQQRAAAFLLFCLQGDFDAARALEKDGREISPGAFYLAFSQVLVPNDAASRQECIARAQDHVLLRAEDTCGLLDPGSGEES